MPVDSSLVASCVPMVYGIAADTAAGLPRHIDRDGLASAGLEALVRAADRFDPSLGVPLARYARIRVRGAMVDELRDTDPRIGPRANPGDAVLSLDRLLADAGAEPHRWALVGPALSPEDVALARDLLDRLRAAVRALPERLRLVVHAAFFTDTTHREAAAAAGIPVGDFYLLRTEAIRLLRLALGVDRPAGERTVALPRRLAA